jgi:hypothetical protein
MMERTKAEQLAGTLNYLVNKGLVPGLLPNDVTAAAEMLVEQEAELKLLREALATKEHIVNATAEREHYRLKIRGEFVIADPRIYFGEIAVDDRTMFGVPERDWELHVARQLTRAATDAWLHDMTECAFVAVHSAIAAGTRKRGDAKQAPSEGCQSGGEAVSP